MRITALSLPGRVGLIEKKNQQLLSCGFKLIPAEIIQPILQQTSRTGSLRGIT
jgi:hypothetical protein